MIKPRAIIAIPFLAALLLAGCSEKQTQAARPVTVPVTVATAVSKTVPLDLRAIGNVEPYSTVSVKSQVNGVVAQVHFKDGQDVTKGQLLFTLDPSSYEADLKKAEGDLDRDIAQAANARDKAARYQALTKEGVISSLQNQEQTSTAESLEASVKADRAAVQYAKVQLGYTRIIAPLSGRAGSVLVYPGGAVKANDNPVLVVINQLEPIFVTFSVPEQYLAAIKERQRTHKLPVQAVIKGEESRPISGELTFVDNTVDPATGTIKLKATFANKDRRLWPGQFVDVVITLGEQPNAVVVPSAVVQTGQQGPFLFVINGDTAEYRQVTTGIRNGDDLVVDKGLKSGEMVVTDGQLRLANGTKVEVKNNNPQQQSPQQPATPAASSGGAATGGRR